MINLKANGRTYTACEPHTLMYAPDPAPATVSGLVDALNNHLSNASGSGGCFVRIKFPAAYSPTKEDKWLRGMYVAQNTNRLWDDYGVFLVMGNYDVFFIGKLLKKGGVDKLEWRKIQTVAA